MRPSASVVVPFAGTQAELDALVARLGALELRDGDELIVADNRAAPAPPADAGPVRWLAAPGAAAPSVARNAGARETAGEWLVFVDSDTDPASDLLDAYLDPAPDPGVGVLAGGVVDVAVRPTLTARYVVARAMTDQHRTLAHPGHPYAQTANCAMLRAAFDDAGGFRADIRAGEDADLCWRLAAAGWRVEARPGAQVEHRARERLPELLRQLAGHGAGAAWLHVHHPGSMPSVGARESLGGVRRGLRDERTSRRDRAAFAVLDLAAMAAFRVGRRRSNNAREEGTR